MTAFFANFTEWKLEKSVNGGLTWTSPGLDTLGNAANGSALPVFNAGTGLYEWLVSRYYRLNNVDTTVIYRLVVASTTANLSNAACNFVTSNPKYVRTANCTVTLPTQVTVRGELQDGGIARILWTSRQETGTVIYTVERSDDAGLHYRGLTTITGTAASGMGNSYTYFDPMPVTGEVFTAFR